MNHATPSPGTWPRFLAHTETPSDADTVLGWGPVRDAGKGSYASRRVFYRAPGGQVCSTIIVARDDPSDHDAQVQADDATFYPFSAAGCYDCGHGCLAHGDAYYLARKQLSQGVDVP